MGSILTTIRFIASPNDPNYFYSSLPETFQSPLVKMLFTILWWHFGEITYGTAGLACLWFYAYVVPGMPLILRELRPMNNFNYNKTRPLYRFSNRLRTIKYLPLIYRSIELIQLNINCLMGVAFIPMQALITQLSLFSICMVITKWKETDGVTKSLLAVWTVGCLMIWSAALEIGGRLNLEGKRLLRSWKDWNWSNKDKKLINKIRNSCRPISLRAGGFHIIKRTSVLKFLKGIVRGTFRALLTIYR